jgi:hypothetical protein
MVLLLYPPFGLVDFLSNDTNVKSLCISIDID